LPPEAANDASDDAASIEAAISSAKLEQ